MEYIVTWVFLVVLIVLASITLGFTAAHNASGSGSSVSTGLADITAETRLNDALEYWSAVALNCTALDHTPLTTQQVDIGTGAVRTAWREHAGPVRTARAMAMVYVAVADAVAGSTGAFAPLRVSVREPDAPAIDVAASVAAAAHGVLAALYTGQAAGLQQAYDAYLAGWLPATQARSAGIVFGQHAAAAVLQWRHSDGAAGAIDPAIDTVADGAGTPGLWQNDPVAPASTALGATWAARVAPFVVPSASAFRVPAPPTLTSAAYTMEYYEARALGGNDSAHDGCVRDAWREFVGVFWAYDGTSGICAPARLYVQLVEAIAASEHVTGTARARLYGLVGLALGDAALTAWDSKYHWRRERPVTAVRGTAAHDGNPGTVPDPGWAPLGAPNTNGPVGAPNFTPPFPAYPSGHAVFGAAVFHVVRRVLGRDAIALHGFVSDEFDGRVRPRVARSFASLSEMEEENGQSRMYLGIHWASDKTAGITQGRAVADYIVDHAYAATTGK